MDLEMQVVARGVAVVADEGDVLARADLVALPHACGMGIPHMAVYSCPASRFGGMVNDNPLTESVRRPDVDDRSCLRRIDLRPVRRGEIYAPMHSAASRPEPHILAVA